MFIIGHRGAAGLAPENTLSSLQAAVDNKVDMVEMDFRQTKDGQIVALHDATLIRTHDDQRGLKRLTLKEVKDLSIGEGREIPTLEEVLIEAKVALNLEIKETGFEEKLVGLIKTFSYEVLVSSSNPVVLKKIRTLDEKVKLGFILGSKWGTFFPLAIALAKTLDLYSIHPYRTIVTPRHMKAIRELKTKIYSWTIDDPHEYVLMKGFGVDGVFTDYPNIITK
jgi:glycerophosphoryl diester phosphodiesterase